MKVLVTTIVALNPGDAAILEGTRLLVEKAFGSAVHVVAADGRAAVARRLYPSMHFVSRPFGGSRGVFGRWISRLGYGHRLQRLDPLRLRLVAILLKLRLGLLARLCASAEAICSVHEYLDADLIVASGGTYLVPAYDLVAPLQDYEFTLWLKKPLGFMPQSMGPFLGNPLEARFRGVFESARFVLVRDRQSSEHLTQIGVPKHRVQIIPDAAFALMRATTGTQTEDRSEPLRIAISVREWRHFTTRSAEEGMEGYRRALAELVEWLVQDVGARVTFLSSCQGIPEYWTDDSKVAAELVATLDPRVARQVHVDTAFREPSVLLDALAAFDLVIATRMHVAILSLCAGVPVVPIAYEFKTKELFDALGLKELVAEIESLTGDALKQRVTLQLAESDHARSAINIRVEKTAQKLEAVPKALRMAMALREPATCCADEPTT